MSYLENNSLVVDTILTSKGRELMARGEFSIDKYALSDDDIPYDLYNPAHPSGSAYYDQALSNLPLIEAISDDSKIMKSKVYTKDGALITGESKYLIDINTDAINLRLDSMATFSPTTIGLSTIEDYIITLADSKYVMLYLSKNLPEGTKTISHTTRVPYTVNTEILVEGDTSLGFDPTTKEFTLPSELTFRQYGVTPYKADNGYWTVSSNFLSSNRPAASPKEFQWWEVYNFSLGESPTLDEVLSNGAWTDWDSTYWELQRLSYDTNTRTFTIPESITNIQTSVTNELENFSTVPSDGIESGWEYVWMAARPGGVPWTAQTKMNQTIETVISAGTWFGPMKIGDSFPFYIYTIGELLQLKQATLKDRDLSIYNTDSRYYSIDELLALKTAGKYETRTETRYRTDITYTYDSYYEFNIGKVTKQGMDFVLVSEESRDVPSNLTSWSTEIKIVGLNTGAIKTIPITITK